MSYAASFLLLVLATTSDEAEGVRVVQAAAGSAGTALWRGEHQSVIPTALQKPFGGIDTLQRAPHPFGPGGAVGPLAVSSTSRSTSPPAPPTSGRSDGKIIHYSVAPPVGARHSAVMLKAGSRASLFFPVKSLSKPVKHPSETPLTPL